LDPGRAHQIESQAQQRVEIVGHHSASMPAQEHRVAISESRGNFVAQLIGANQHRGVVDRRAAIKVHAAVGDDLDPVTGNTDRIP
jgi:hypothetical protein